MRPPFLHNIMCIISQYLLSPVAIFFFFCLPGLKRRSFLACTHE